MIQVRENPFYSIINMNKVAENVKEEKEEGKVKAKSGGDDGQRAEERKVSSVELIFSEI